jgi:hypothetical protein
MNFQDIVDKNNEQFEILKELGEFKNSVVNAKLICDNIYNYLFLNCYRNSNMHTLNNYSISQSQLLREKLIAIDGYDLKYTINKVRNVYSNKIMNSLLDQIEQNYRKIIEIRKVADSKTQGDNFLLLL